MDLAKVDNKQHVFSLVGMNDGTMPQPVTASSLITDEENVEQQADVSSPTSDILQMDEAFVCYIAMTEKSATRCYIFLQSNGIKW